MCVCVCVCPGEGIRADLPGQGSGGEGHGAQAVPAAPRLLGGGRELPPELRPLLRDRGHHTVRQGQPKGHCMCVVLHGIYAKLKGTYYTTHQV